MKNNTKFIVGLGNPGPRYVDTRHNFGWFVVDELAGQLGIKNSRETCGGMFCKSDNIALFKPLSFMNKSGGPLARLAGKLDIQLEDILVIMDDLALTLGTVRLRRSGSAGGHRGLRDIMDSLGTEDIARLRLGIGPRPEKIPARAFVLGKFQRQEWETVEKVVEWSAEAVKCWAAEGIKTAMDKYNRDLTEEN